MVDVDWGVSFPWPLTPKASLLQSLLSTFSDFNHRNFKNPVNSTVPSHSIKTSLSQQPAERPVDAYRRVLQIKAHQACLDTPAVQKACLDTSWSAASPVQVNSRWKTDLASTKLLQDCIPQLLTQPYTCSCLAPRLLTWIPEILMSAGQGQQCYFPLGLTYVGHPTSFFLWHTSSASSTSLRL